MPLTRRFAAGRKTTCLPVGRKPKQCLTIRRPVNQRRTLIATPTPSHAVVVTSGE